MLALLQSEGHSAGLWLLFGFQFPRYWDSQLPLAFARKCYKVPRANKSGSQAHQPTLQIQIRGASDINDKDQQKFLQGIVLGIQPA